MLLLAVLPAPPSRCYAGISTIVNGTLYQPPARPASPRPPRPRARTAPPRATAIAPAPPPATAIAPEPPRADHPANLSLTSPSRFTDGLRSDTWLWHPDGSSHHDVAAIRFRRAR